MPSGSSWIQMLCLLPTRVLRRCPNVHAPMNSVTHPFAAPMNMVRSCWFNIIINIIREISHYAVEFSFIPSSPYLIPRLIIPNHSPGMCRSCLESLLCMKKVGCFRSQAGNGSSTVMLGMNFCKIKSKDHKNVL